MAHPYRHAIHIIKVMRKMYTVRAETETNNKNAAVMLGFVGPSVLGLLARRLGVTDCSLILPQARLWSRVAAKPAEPPSAVSLPVLPL